MKIFLFITRLNKLFQVIQSKRLCEALFKNRVLAGAEHKQVLQADLSTVIDIGANRGQFSLAARHWAPKAHIIAFEPLSEPSAIYRKVFKGDQNVKLHQSAIGTESGETTIHVSASDDSSSLLPISNIQKRLFPGTEEIRTETIKVGRLSDFISENEILPPAMLKMDVQGFELNVLEGTKDLIHRFEWVYAECSFQELYKGQALADEVIEWLRMHRFRLTGVYNMCYDENGKAIQGDFLFQKSNS